MTRPGALSLLLVAGCAAWEPEVEFAATRLTESERQSWATPGVESVHRHITVRRVIDVPACRHLDAVIARSGRELVLRVTATRADEPCQTTAGPWGYLALIENLTSGPYQLRVIHSFPDDAAQPETVLRHQVVVE